MEKIGCSTLLTTGEAIVCNIDAQLLGFTTFVFQRYYRTCAVKTTSSMGFGWSHSLMHEITFTNNKIIWQDHENTIRTIVLPSKDQTKCTNLLGGNEARFLEENHYLIKSDAFGDLSLLITREGNKGVITALTDDNGNELILRYYQSGRIGRLENPRSGYSLAFKYFDLDKSDNGSMIRLASIVLEKKETTAEMQLHWKPISTVMRYEYHTSGQLKSATNSVGHSEYYEYRADHVITLRRLAGGLEFYWVWEGKGKDAKALEHSSNTPNFSQKYVWNEDKGAVTVTHHDGSIERYRHDQKTARLLTKEDPDGAITTYTYDAEGNLVKEIDPLSNTTQYFYDNEGQLLGYLLPNQLSIKYEYDSKGNRIRKKVQDNELTLFEVTHFAYEERGHCIKETNALGNIRQFEWSTEGKLTKVHHPDGAVEQFNYNNQGQLISARTIGGATHRYDYNELGYLSAKTINNKTTYYQTDGIGNVLKITHPNGSSIHYTYNAYNKVTSIKDELGQITRYEYAAPLHLVTKEIQPDGSAIGYQYDNGKNFLSHITNAKGEAYQIEYYSNGLVKKEQTFDGRVFDYHYDLNGFLTKRIERGAGQTPETAIITDYQRDALGHLIQKSLSDHEGAIHKRIHYRYDALGRLCSADDGDYPLSYEYDALGRLITEHQGYASTRYSYDGAGNLSSMTLPDKNIIRYHHQHSILTSIDLNDQLLTRHHFNGINQEIQRDFGDNHQLFNYDEQQRLTQQTVKQHSNTPLSAMTSLLERNYHYDAASNLIGIKDSLMGNKSYRYDRRNRLIQAVHTPTDTGLFAAPEKAFHTLERDKNKPLVEQIIHDAADNVMGINLSDGDLNKVRISNNLLYEQNDHHYQYDDFGRLIQIERVTLHNERGQHSETRTLLSLYEYDIEHRLVRFSDLQAELDFSYRYDAFGRRTQKINNKTQETTHFLWQGDRLLVEFKGDGLLESDDHPLNQAYCTYLYEGGGFAPLALLKGKGNTATPYFYLNDHLGTPQQLVDQNGAIVWAGLFSAYGKRESALVDEVKQPLRFQGQYHDEESDLYYNRHRYYDPSTARFITCDPIGLAGGLNNTQYVKNPTGWIDPLGLQNIPSNCACDPTYVYRGVEEGPFDVFENGFQGRGDSANLYLHAVDNKNPGSIFVSTSENICSGILKQDTKIEVTI